MSKRLSFRTGFGKQRVSEFETLSKSARHHVYRMSPWIRDKLSWKKSVLVGYQIVGLFVNILTAEYKYSRRNPQNIQKQLQTQLSLKLKDFSGFFIGFLKCTSSLEHFGKEGDPSSLSIPEIVDSAGRGYLNV